MDVLTDLISTEIKRQYKSVRKFSQAIDIPQTTLASAIKNGVSGTAYETIVKICKALNIQLINYKFPILRKIDNKFYACGTPWCGKEGSNKNVCVPIKGICILERGADNKIDYAENKEALLFLLTQTPIPQKKESAEQMLDNLGKLIESVPVYRLRCNMEPAACDVAYGAMSGDVIGKKAEF